MTPEKTMTLRLALIALCAACVLISGCALLDGLLLEPRRDEQGRPLFTDENGELTTVPQNPLTGQPHRPAFTGSPSPLAREAATALGGPWGALAGAGAGLLASLYAALRGRRRLAAERARSHVWQDGMTLLVKMIEDIKAGRAAARKDGVTSLREIREFVRRRGKDAVHPEFLAEVVRVLNSNLPEADKQAALARAAH